MASIRRHPNARYRWQVRYRDPSGRQRSKNFAKKSDAEKYASLVEADKVRGLWLDPDLRRMPYREWWSRWHSGRVNLRESSRVRDETFWRSIIAPQFGDTPIGRLKAVDLRSWIASLLEAGRAPATVRKAAQLVGASLEAAVDDGIIGSNPARKLPLPQVPAQEMHFMTPNEIEKLAGAVDARYRTMVVMAAYTGMRFGEIAGLSIEQLNLLGRRVTVSQQLSEVAGTLSITEPKSAASKWAISLPRFLCEEVGQYLTEHPPSQDRLVFQAPSGGPIRRTNFRRRVWLPAVESVGRVGFRFHDLRHSHAAILISQGEHPKVIQARLGHASISTTLNTYGHLFDGLDQAAADRLDAIWADGAQTSITT